MHDTRSKIEEIKKQLSTQTVFAQRLSPLHIENRMEDFLLSGLSFPEASELFYCATRIYTHDSLFYGTSRKIFRGRIAEKLGKWIDECFDDSRNASSISISKFYSTFSGLRFRIPTNLHKFLKKGIREYKTPFHTRDCVRIISYYAHTGDDMPTDIFYNLAQFINNQGVNNLLPHEIGVVCRNIAILDSMNPKLGVQSKISPHVLFEVIQNSATETESPFKQQARDWFNGREVYFPPRYVDDFIRTRIKVFSEAMRGAGLKIREDKASADSSVQQSPLERMSDLIVEFGNRAIGITFDSRGSYVETMLRGNQCEGIFYPGGFLVFSGESLKRKNEKTTIIRIPPRIGPPKLEQQFLDVLKTPENLDAGMYSYDQAGQILPLKGLRVPFFLGRDFN